MNIAKLTKTSNSLRAAFDRGWTIQNARTMSLIDRYESLRMEFHSTPEGIAAWNEWCKERGYCVTHNAYDYGA